ncbi:MAG: type II toxin-antitoxin system HicB family antitoxin [Eubacteriales bacterium]|nr:type II toxin-antitoxin system HicB family antitoxin [Eubacteriales bacterium]
MNNMMKYKGYYAHIEYSDDDNCFFGKITGIADIVSFEGESIIGLKQAFIDAVDDYLDICIRQGKEPQKAYKGSFNVRIDPDLHKEAAIIATAKGISLNQLVEKAVRNYVKC